MHPGRLEAWLRDSRVRVASLHPKLRGRAEPTGTFQLPDSEGTCQARHDN